jgi:GAF domain-containing protein
MLNGRVDEYLLAVAGAVSADGGDGVVGVLRTLLERAAPFDAGEVAVAGPAGFQRWTLTDDDTQLVGEDLLMHVGTRPHPVRLDDLHEVAPYARTLELLQRRRLRSLLVLPLSSAGGIEGAISLACGHGWAFVGCSLRQLVPIAGMAGIALQQARALTALRRRADSDGLRADVTGVPEESSSERADFRQLSEVQVELQGVLAELAQERESGAELATRVGRLLEERDALESEMAELRRGVAAREGLLAPASDVELKRSKRRR